MGTKLGFKTLDDDDLPLEKQTHTCIHFKDMVTTEWTQIENL